MISTTYLEAILDDKKKLYLVSEDDETLLTAAPVIDLAVTFSAKNKSLKEGNIEAWMADFISQNEGPEYLALRQEHHPAAHWEGTIDVLNNSLILPSWYFLKEDGLPSEIRYPQDLKYWTDGKGGTYDADELRAALIMLNQKTKLKFTDDPGVEEEFQSGEVEFNVRPGKNDFYSLQNQIFRFDGDSFQEYIIKR